MNLDEFKTLDQLAASLKSLGLGPLIINVKSFGAKGDDATDDTAAIQSAIDQAATGNRGAVFFPAGTYRISSSLIISNQLSLIGSSHGGTLLKATASITMIKMENGSEVRDLRLIGNDRTSANSIGIKIGGNASYPNVQAVIKNIMLMAGHYYGIYSDYELDNTLIEHIEAFSLITKAAIYIKWDGATGAKTAGLTIRRCHLSPPAIIGEQINYGIYIQGTDDCRLEQNIVNNFDCCVYINGSASSGVWNLAISGLHSEDGRAGVHNGTRWSASAAVSADDIIVPTKANATGFVYKAQGSGTTGGTEPTWPTSYGSTVVDNDVTWEAYAQSIAICLPSAYILGVRISGVYAEGHIYGIEN